MKTFLIVWCVLNLKYYLQAAPDSILVGEQTFYPDSNEKFLERCETNYEKLRDEVDWIKKHLPLVSTTAKYETTSESTTGTPLLKLGSYDLFKMGGLGRTDENEEIIKKLTNAASASPIIPETREISTFDLKIEQINRNLEKLAKNVDEKRAKLNDFLKDNGNVLKPFEEFSAKFYEIINTKFEQQEIELKNLKAQNQQYLKQLNQFIELLSQQRPQFQENIDKIEKSSEENYASFRNYLNNLNGTIMEHFGKQNEKLNEHDILFKLMKEECNKSAESENIRTETSIKLLEKLLKRFDIVEQKLLTLETSTESNKNCAELQELDIDVYIVDAIEGE